MTTSESEAYAIRQARYERQTIEWASLDAGYAQVTMPTQAYIGDAGWDLYVSESTEIPPGQFADVPCGVGVALPEDTWGLLTGRSSTLRNRGLLVHQGVIDQGYRGPLFAGVFNLGPDVAVVEAGARIAQLIVIPIHVHRVEYVDRLREGERGSAGFGSSGA